MLYICNTTKAQSSFSSEKTERPPKVQNFSRKLTITYESINQQGKMIPYFLVLILICHISNVSTMDINLGDLPNNVLKFGYGINYKYMGKVSHSFDRFYVVTKFELPKVKDLKFDDIPYDAECAHLDNRKPGQILGILKDVKRYCIKIAPHIEYYRKQIAYYNQTAADILTNELTLILPTFPTQDRQKRGIITSLITGFIGLAYEGISSFLHHKRQKALHKAVNAIDNKVDLQRNKIFHLEDSMVMYGVYNSDTLEDLIDTVHKLHNRTTWNEKLFSGQIENWYNYYSSSSGMQHYAINSLLFLTTVREKYVKMYERFLNQLRQYSQAIRVLSKGYLPITLLSPSKLNKILQKVRETVQKENKDYDILIKRLYLYYDMKLVTFGIDDKRNLIVQFPVFVHPHNQQHLTLYQLETVPIPIIDRNKNAQSYTHLQVTKPYIALNSETYISLRIQELEACKKIGYEYYCEELFVVKHRSQHNCESAIYFDSNDEIIKENCEFQYFYNKTDVKPAVLDGGNEIILANWPKSKYVICKDNHEYPIKIPRHPYILLKRSVLCNCDIHAEEHSLLESIATCPGKQSDMTIYYTVNTAFMPYLDTFKEDLELPNLEINQNWTTQKQILPISLQATPFDSRLLNAPKTLKGMVQQYKQKSKMLDKTPEDKPKDDFFDNIAIDIFLFAAAIISMLTIIAIIHLMCRHSKLKALLTGIAFQPVNQAEAAVTKQANEFCTAQWYAIAALTVLTILLIVYICVSNQKCAMFKRRLYSNTVTIMLFFSDVKQYVPVKLCKTAGSIHLFQIYGQLDPNQIILEKNCLWDMIKIDWKEVFVTLNGTIVRMPKTVKIPLRDKYRLRTLMDKHSLLLHVMLRQGTSWYALDKMDSETLLPPPLQESEC